MAPQRRKHVDSTEDKQSSKKRKNGIFSSFYRRSPRFQEESYSEKRCLALFSEFTTGNPELIEPEGVEKFCQCLQVEPEDVVMLVIAWKMKAKRMGYFTKQEWLLGLSELEIDSIFKLRNKLDFLRSLLDDDEFLKYIYRYAFDFTREKDQRSIDLENANMMLQLLLGSRWNLFPKFQSFLQLSRYNVINKDQWCNILEFSRVIHEDLSNYDEDGAWPVMLDEFVDWLKKQ